nr:uncharacterized protein LOC129135883 [Pan troglodytes]
MHASFSGAGSSRRRHRRWLSARLRLDQVYYKWLPLWAPGNAVAPRSLKMPGTTEPQEGVTSLAWGAPRSGIPEGLQLFSPSLFSSCHLQRGCPDECAALSREETQSWSICRHVVSTSARPSAERRPRVCSSYGQAGGPVVSEALSRQETFLPKSLSASCRHQPAVHGAQAVPAERRLQAHVEPPSALPWPPFHAVAPKVQRGLRRQGGWPINTTPSMHTSGQIQTALGLGHNFALKLKQALGVRRSQVAGAGTSEPVGEEEPPGPQECRDAQVRNHGWVAAATPGRVGLLPLPLRKGRGSYLSWILQAPWSRQPQGHLPHGSGRHGSCSRQATSAITSKKVISSINTF